MKIVAIFKSLVIFVNGHWEEKEVNSCEIENWQSQSRLQFSALKGRQAIARGTVSDYWRNALGLNKRTILFAPNSVVVQKDAVPWGKTDNLQK